MELLNLHFSTLRSKIKSLDSYIIQQVNLTVSCWGEATSPQHHPLHMRQVAPWAVPLAQSDSGQLDQVSHAGRDDDGLLVRVARLVVALHLLHHELSVAQQRVLGEAVEVEAGGRHGGLQERDSQASHLYSVQWDESEFMQLLEIDRCVFIQGR